MIKKIQNYIAFVFLFCAFSSFAATKTASVTGNWSNTATWGGAAVPGAADDIVVNTGITVTMTADYTTTGTLTLNGTGTIQMAAYNLTGGSLTASGSAVINNGGAAKTLTVGSANTSTTYTGTLTNAINLVKTGSGTFTFSPTGSLTFRNVDVTAGTLDITSGTITLSAEIEYGNRLRANGGTLTVSGGSIDALGGYVVVGFGANGTANFTGGNVTADAMMVGWNGIGTVTVSSGTLDFWWRVVHYDGGTGTVTINGGTVIAGDVFNSTGSGNTNTDYLTVNLNSGGTLQANSIYVTAEQDDDGNSANTPPHTTNLNLNGGTLTAGGTNNLFATNSHASGSSTGQLYVNLLAASYINTNGYTATLLVAINDAASSFGITVQGAGTLVYGVTNTYDGATTISAGTLQVGNGSTTGSIASTSIVNNATLTYNRSDDITISAVISGTGGVTQYSTATLTLSGANTYTGTTFVYAGKIKLGATGVISNSSAVYIGTSAVFDMNTYSETVGSIAGVGDVDNVAGGGTPTLTCGGDNTSTTFAGAFKNTSGTLAVTKTGTGTMSLTGTNTAAGALNVSDGVLSFASANAAGNFSSITVANTAQLMRQTNGTISQNITATGTGTDDGVGGRGVLYGYANGGAMTYNGTIALGGSNRIGVYGATISHTLNGAISGTGYLKFWGGGASESHLSTFNLNAAGSWTGATYIEADFGSVTKLILGGNNYIPTGTDLTMSATWGGSSDGAGAYLNLNSYNQTLSTLTASGSKKKVFTGSGTLTVSGAFTISGGSNYLVSGIAVTPSSGITVSSGTLYFGDNSSSATVNGNIANSSAVVFYNNSSSTYSGVISGTGTLTQAGSGTQTITGANTYTGTTTVSAGTLQLGASGVISNSSNVVMNGGYLSTGSGAGYSETVGTLTLSANSRIVLGTGSHALNFAASNGTTWTGGTLLRITGWQGSWNCTTGTSGQIFSGSSAELSAGKLAQIFFTEPTSGTPRTACQLASGEIVPTSTLPVKLVSFTGEKGKNFNELFWITASEINSDYFEIQRSSDAINFESIGTVKGAGNYNDILSYTFVDYEQPSGTSYYRLKQYDYDGQNETFNIVAIDNNSSEFKMNALFPNPTSASMTVNFQSGEAGSHFIFINDAQGNEVFAAMIATLQGENLFVLPTQNYASGTYFVRIVSPKKETISSQIVVQH
ncbi:MAG: autotransporter-associated beta strand repeat-containing protein [Bacteroidetes bacterium]|nr:autotransporter-associated beta strand repeat-containing protein [Bacteroidota bacterium]